MTDELTDKLGLPIPESLHAGDSNDVEAMAATTDRLLSIIDRAAGDYISASTPFEGDTLTTDFDAGTGAYIPVADISSDDINEVALNPISLPDLLDAGGSHLEAAQGPGTEGLPEGYDGFIDGVQWPTDMSTEFATLSADGTITINRAGNYNVYITVTGVADCVESGSIVATLDRTDLPVGAASMMLFTPFHQEQAINNGSLSGKVTSNIALAIGTNFYRKDVVLVPNLSYINNADTPTEDKFHVSQISVAIERI